MRRLYRYLLYLLPARRRTEHGEAMTEVFTSLEHDARDSPRALFILWMKEIGGLIRFSFRDRLAAVRARFSAGDRPPRRRRSIVDELRWAWRSVRRRRARAWLIIVLLGVALAANTVMFSVADSLVFDRAPYRDVHRLVEIQSARTAGGPRDRFISIALFDEWRKQSDLFVGVEGYLNKNVFLTAANGEAELVSTVDVTPGLIALLGVSPEWGRPLVAGDDQDAAAQHVLISEALARKRFGDPDAAPGRQLQTTTSVLIVAGVMPRGFRFPEGSVDIWRALDPHGPLMAGFSGMNSIARVSPGLSLEALRTAMAARSSAIASAAGRTTTYSAAPGPFYVIAPPASQRTLFLVLFGAAACLWLIACANVASLELVSVTRRARTYAVQLALGASRGTLARVALLEGAWLIAGAVAIALGLTLVVITPLATYLPEGLRFAGGKPIDVDWRTFAFLSGAAAVTWLLASLPIVVFSSRVSEIALLKSEGRTAALSQSGSRGRRALTAVEIALAVPLIIGGILYARSYLALVATDKGFESSNLAQISLTVPMQYYPAGLRGLSEDLAAALRTVPGVIAVTPASAPPALGDSPSEVHVEIDDRGPDGNAALVGRNTVDADYFKVVGLPVLSGRMFLADEPPTSAIVPQMFARRFWPNEDAVGHSFRLSTRQGWLRIVGIVGDIHRDPRPADGAGSERMYYYAASQPPPPPAPVPSAASGPLAAGGWYGRPSVTLRIDGPDRAAAALAKAKTVDPRLHAELRFVADVYSNQYADVLLATRIVVVFAGIAFFIAIIGVYGVMAFLVVSRTREIGIRMALGAERRDVMRLVLGSATRLVIIGSTVGLAASAVLARLVRAQLFGVSPIDPWTYSIVVLSVTATAILATWQPARHAARVDPSMTLRTE
jgi:predicted permease